MRSTPLEGEDVAWTGLSQAEDGSLKRCILSIDVEDWFHILDVPSAPKISKWPDMPSRVERNFIRLLDLLDRSGAKVTCFFLAWVAERFPNLVTEAVKRGHEIASHGYAHELVFRMKPGAFLEDIRKAKNILEQVSGGAVRGYRAPGFSCTEEVPWFFETLAEAGYAYDSSVFPGVRGHGGMRSGDLRPGMMETKSGSVAEIPITVANLFGTRVCLFGGGYLRLFPYGLIRRMTRRVLAENRPVVFYVHPREIDPEQPRLEMGFIRRTTTYLNLKSTESKLEMILRDFEVMNFKQFLTPFHLQKNPL